MEHRLNVTDHTQIAPQWQALISGSNGDIQNGIVMSYHWVSNVGLLSLHP